MRRYCHHKLCARHSTVHFVINFLRLQNCLSSFLIPNYLKIVPQVTKRPTCKWIVELKILNEEHKCFLFGWQSWQMLMVYKKMIASVKGCNYLFSQSCHILIAVAPNKLFYSTANIRRGFIYKLKGSPMNPLHKRNAQMNIYWNWTKTALLSSDQTIMNKLEPGVRDCFAPGKFKMSHVNVSIIWSPMFALRSFRSILGKLQK
jgi:hypothetical protein